MNRLPPKPQPIPEDAMLRMKELFEEHLLRMQDAPPEWWDEDEK